MSRNRVVRGILQEGLIVWRGSCFWKRASSCRIRAITPTGVGAGVSARRQDPRRIIVVLILFQPGYYDVSRGASTEGALQRCQPGVSVDGGLGHIERFGA